MSRIYSMLFFWLLTFALTGCDIIRPQKKFKMAVAKEASLYNLIHEHLSGVFNAKGYTLELIEAESSLKAAEMVAQGEADFLVMNNFSYFIPEELGRNVANLRTIMPLANRYFYLFSKEPVPDSIPSRELFSNKTIGLEYAYGEPRKNLERLFVRAHIEGVKFVTFNETSDLVAYWGNPYGKIPAKFLNEGWHPVSFHQNWIDFNTKFDPAIDPFTIPSLPGDSKSRMINTFTSNVILVGGVTLGENAVFEISKLIFQDKLELLVKDRMYLAIKEDFVKSAMLFPVHDGTNSYLSRDQPTILERYADTIALLITVGALIFGFIEAVKRNILQKKKDRVDIYFLRYLETRTNDADGVASQIQRLKDLHNQALVQMTKEKLDKGDFHMLSRLIQQELMLLKTSEPK